MPPRNYPHPEEESLVWVKFADEELWHQRVVHAVVPSGLVITTPDQHTYIEKWSDYEQVVLGGPRGGSPPERLGQPRYTFLAADLPRLAAAFGRIGGLAGLHSARSLARAPGSEPGRCRC